MVLSGCARTLVPGTSASTDAAIVPAPPRISSAGLYGQASASEVSPSLAGGAPVREFQRGGASWYGPGFHGRQTASGERYDMHALTAAHRTLPFGTVVRVRSLGNGREVDVRITDRGPFSGRRVIDLSRAAAAELGMLGLGVKDVVLMIAETTLTNSAALPPP